MTNIKETVPSVVIERTQKWDSPFGESMSDKFIADLLDFGPFAQIKAEKTKEGDAEKTQKRLQPILNILKNESRILKFSSNQLVYNQNDYGNSAYIIIEGTLLNSPLKDKKTRQKKAEPKKGLISSLIDQLSRPKWAEVRERGLDNHVISSLHSGKIINKYDYDLSNAVQYKSGDVLGLLSAIRRSPRYTAAIAETDCVILEIKWQGLRDLMSSSKRFKEYCDQLYRKRGLRRELRSYSIFDGISAEDISEFSSKIVFESFGKRNWLDTNSNVLNDNKGSMTEAEPKVVLEGDYASAVNLVSFGFVRVTKKLGDNEVTVGFLKPGDIIGLDELYQNGKSTQKLNYQNGYNAIGYVDVIRIPVALFDKFLIKNNEKLIQTLIANNSLRQMNDPSAVSAALLGKSTSIVNKLINHRLINGTKAMVINTEQCVGCDDCVRACASTHNINPRFVRQGVRIDKLMVANACMHCVDPLCLIGCPTGAIRRSESEGQVYIKDSACIGCATCANNCPYQNIRMVHIFDKKGNVLLDEKNTPIVKASKCDFCYQKKVSPACERACPHGALRRIDLQNIHELLEWVGE